MADIPDTVIVLFVILGAAATVCMGYAVHKLFYRPVATNFNAKSEPQLDYMREVRDRSKIQDLSTPHFKSPGPPVLRMYAEGTQAMANHGYSLVEVW
ncbi:hypothetical protein B0A52_09282 [Exophiala mesophila]|uniref:Uncharacterized protein n=1 Tax=Exophiala mesophila TaxID=212818 RepID=A0A438MU37_EXOME|nr:hypothetical protein B0A52_09282 [Exophiala mesophila]